MHPKGLCRCVTTLEHRAVGRSVIIVVVQITWLPHAVLWTPSAINARRKGIWLVSVAPAKLGVITRAIGVKALELTGCPQ